MYVGEHVLMLIFWSCFSSQICWEVHLKFASDKLIQVLESPEIHGSTSECMTANIFIYSQGMVTVCHVYPFPVQHRMPDCVVALWWRSTSQRTSRRLPCWKAVDDGEWFQDRIWVKYDYYPREFSILLVKGDIDSQWFRKLHWILVGKLCISARLKRRVAAFVTCTIWGFGQILAK